MKTKKMNALKNTPNRDQSGFKQRPNNVTNKGVVVNEFTVIIYSADAHVLSKITNVGSDS